MNLYPIDTGTLKLDGGAMFGVVPKSLWSKVYPADENNLCTWAMRCLLVETGNRRLLIDNGAGDYHDEKFKRLYGLDQEGALEKSLAAHGYTSDDITDVLLTHLHFDHCGGSVKYSDDRSSLVPAFPKATYWISKTQWENALHPNKREKASFLRESFALLHENNQLQFIEREGELFPGISLRIFNGHTDGQVIPFIRYQNTTVVFTADLIPSSAHIPLPWILSFDMQPMITLKEKEEFLNAAADHQYVLFLEHDIFTECCTVQRTEKGVRVKDRLEL
ncbi:MAG TPA: MBL fold metallo-hydrolase [Bacteroidales bacterium]|nr:MBL fold metallo-hydrolase [Bacteroidales bacterium]HNS46601.1 MBL fold metallo-hydrolase [Bacteroidales bacterium]